ncbi:unnamed protein product [Acanthoscelides obtectus]|uniref:Protein TsetseEP domain-containing protein n=1 Tax=Acanthoscelides obtectus TaxID=200917 RepID=A0A9P0LN14_ACAOB|nr:unnamed protein product [Acanthoscelides obtectus]CAK1686799.1 hypothetical protein AOBTE_LOCUS36077 [Acanthoscelides obtectus]
MFGKKVVVFSLVVLAVVSQVHENKVDDLLRRLKAAVDKAMVQAQEQLDRSKVQLQQHAAEDVADGRAQIEVSKKGYVDQLDKIKADNKDKDISSCLGENETKLNNLVTDYGTQMDNCVNDNINEGTKYAQDALDRVKKIVSDVENIRQEIKDCGHGWKAAKCIAKLAVRIEKEITNLPTIIEGDVVATAARIAQLDPKLKGCATDKVNEARTQGQTLLDTIKQCVANIH